MKTIKNVALICFDNPFLKPAEGGKIGMMTRIESLALLDDISVDVFMMNKASEGMVSTFPIIRNVQNYFQYQMGGGLKTVFSSYPICTNKRYVEDLANEISKKEYDFAIYEGLQVAKYRFNGNVNAKKHILYFHDIESEYRLQLSKSQKNLVKKIANKFESEKFKKLENQVDENFDFLWFVSKEECERFCKEKNISTKKAMYIPFPAKKVSERISSGKNKNTMIYIGDLSLENNFSSLDWFIKNVYKTICEKNKDVEFKIIGKISDENKKLLQGERIEVLGYVDDIEKYYDESAFIVSPVLFGAGVKVKIIDSLSYGQIIVTTKKGIEGMEIDENQLICSDDSNELAEKCLEILNDRSKFVHLSENALAYIRENHSIEHQANLIKQTFEILGEEKN